MKSALKFLSGSAVTYVLMAACADRPNLHVRRTAGAAGANSQTVASGGVPTTDAGAMANGGSPSTVAEGGNDDMMMVDAAVDVMVDPVPDAAAEPATDGTRLKAVYLVGADGAKQWHYAWWDSKLSVECSFTQFVDGSTRCVPAAAASRSYFTDAGCMVPLFIAAAASCPGGPSALYALGTLSVACGAAVYSAAYKLTPVDPPKVYSGTPAACSDITTAAKPNPPTYTFYTGTEVPLSDFVSATKQHG